MSAPAKSVRSNPADDKKIVQEMLPFMIYAAIPIAITLIIAFTFGYTHQ